MISVARPLAENLDELKKNTHSIHTIMDLEDSGFKVHCALDFSEIYSHAFPMEAISDRWTRDLHRKVEEASLLQTGLDFLIRSDRNILQKQLLILPQHLLEMRDIIALKAARVGPL